MIQHTSSGVSGARGLNDGLDLSRSAMPLSKRGSPIFKYYQRIVWTLKKYRLPRTMTLHPEE
jgi:hypothetical protein